MRTLSQGLRNCAIVTFATLVVALAGATWSSGQKVTPDGAKKLAPTGSYRPAEVPSSYVITPVGYFHPSCVFQLAENETLLADGRVQRANGAVSARVPTCAYPHYTPKALLGRDSRAGLIGRSPAINGWLEYYGATTNTSYGEISATWIVPPGPTTNESQTLFFFPGLQDTTDDLSIVQPVLQFGPSSAGGGAYWTMASWNCCMSGTVWHSPLKKVSVGDTILGTITPTCKQLGQDYCATWKIVTEDVTSAKKSILNKTPAEGQIWNWGFGAVAEVYGVKQCTDFPANQGLLFTAQLYDENKNPISNPGWVPSPAGAGVTPACSYGLSETGSDLTLEY